MNFSIFQNDETLAAAPIECSYDNPNCLGGWSMILSARDVRDLPLRDPWGYGNSPPMQTLNTGNVPLSNSVLTQQPPAISIGPAATAQDTNELPAFSIDSKTLLIGAAVLGIILILN